MQQLIDLVGGDDEAVLSAELGEPLAAFEGERLAGRIVEGRDRVHELRTMLREQLFELPEVHAASVERHADDLEPMVAEDRQRIRIGRVFDEYRVARLGEAAADEVERLGNACAEQQRVRRRFATGIAKESGERRPESHIALPRTVVQLERLRALEVSIAGAAQQSERQQVGRGLPDAEIDRAAFRRAVERGCRAHAAPSGGGTSRNTSSGRPSRKARMFSAEMRRRSSRAASE